MTLDNSGSPKKPSGKNSSMKMEAGRVTSKKSSSIINSERMKVGD